MNDATAASEPDARRRTLAWRGGLFVAALAVAAAAVRIMYPSTPPLADVFSVTRIGLGADVPAAQLYLRFTADSEFAIIEARYDHSVEFDQRERLNVSYFTRSPRLGRLAVFAVNDEGQTARWLPRPDFGASVVLRQRAIDAAAGPLLYVSGLGGSGRWTLYGVFGGDGLDIDTVMPAIAAACPRGGELCALDAATRAKLGAVEVHQRLFVILPPGVARAAP